MRRPALPRTTVPRTALLRAAVPTAVLAVLATSACTPNDPTASAAEPSEGGPAAVSVSSTADACTLSAAEAPAGHVRFSVTNDGDDVTEFYLYAADGERIVSEAENIGPGTSRDLVVTLDPGRYVTACKPGMVGDGIRADFTVTDSGNATGTAAGGAAGGADAAALDAAAATYVTYVSEEAAKLLSGTEVFTAAVKAGDDDTARAWYAPTRTFWERIEPVAESFGDLDPRMDAREADLEDGQEWTGWHVLEKDLWQPAAEANGGVAYTPLTAEQRTQYADQLLSDTQELVSRIHADDFASSLDATAIGNGAKGLLDEVATGKITGEEEIWSHTDLADFQANVDGAQVAYQTLRDVAAGKDADLTAELDTRFAALQEILSAYRSGPSSTVPEVSEFVRYTELSTDEVRELAAAVDALSEPLSKLTSAVVL